MQTSVSERLPVFEASSGKKPPSPRFSRKELDQETGFYYYGARYLNPKTSMWISADPAMGDYIPQAPVNDDAERRNGNLPGMGGVFNYVNMHVYHYAGNNPLKYIDPDGKQQLPPAVQNQPAYRNMLARQAEINAIVEELDLATDILQTNNLLSKIIDKFFLDGKLENRARYFYFEMLKTRSELMAEYKKNGFFDTNNDGNYSSREIVGFTNFINGTIKMNYSDQRKLGPYWVKLPILTEGEANVYLNNIDTPKFYILPLLPQKDTPEN
jgi:RHS repeat-associated protein